MYKTLVTLICLSAVQLLNAQITYVDFTPDKVHSTNTVKAFDLDADGNNDIAFDLYVLDPMFDVWLKMDTYNGAELSTDSTDYDFVHQFENGEDIDANLQWDSGNGINLAYLTSGTPEGNWPGTSDKFLAFRIPSGSGFRYGWMRLSMHSLVNNITINDYAISDNVDEFILAGQTESTVGVTAHKNNEFTVLHTENKINIENPLHLNLTVKLLSTNGSVVVKQQTSSSSDALSFNEVPAGIYIVMVESNTQKQQFKIAVSGTSSF